MLNFSLRFWTKNSILGLVILFYGLLSITFVFNHLYDINPDGISYIEIAHLYKEGLVLQAINAYWSPAQSFILLLLSYIFEWVIASKIAILILSLLWIILSYKLSSIFFINRIDSIYVVLLVSLFRESHKIWTLITPDLFISAYVLFVLIMLYRALGRKKINDWFVIGLLSGIGFLIKTIFLVFSLLFFPIVIVIFYKHKLFNSLLYFIIGLFLVVFLWVFVLYIKYDEITVGTSGILTYKTFVLNESFSYLNEPKMYPQQGTSFWHDPSSFEPFNFSINKQLSAIIINLQKTILFIFRNFHIGLLLIIVGLYSFTISNRLKILMLFVFLWIFLHLFILVESRYLWPIITPVIILLTTASKKLNIKYFYFFIFVSALLFIISYYKYLPDYNGLIHKEISNSINPPCVLLSNQWQRGLYIAYFSGCKYYGVTKILSKEVNIENELQKEILEGKVTHLLVFNSSKFNEIGFINKTKSWSFPRYLTAVLYEVKNL